MKLRPIPKVLVVPAMIVTAMSQAHAGLISTSGGTSGFAASNANIVGYEPIGVVNATLMLSAPAELTYTYVGKKAAWNNEFVAVGQFGEALRRARRASHKDRDDFATDCRMGERRRTQSRQADAFRNT